MNVTTPMHTPPHLLNRRQWLKSVSAIGALNVLPLGKAMAAMGELRVGMFLPKSARYPTMSAEYLAGFKVAMHQAGMTGSTIEPIHYGPAPGPAIRQAGELLEARRVDILAGVISPEAASDLRPQLARYNTPLLVSDAGANRMPAQPNDPLFQQHSLEYWQSCAAFGQWAAGHLGRRAVIAMGFLESGYDFPNAFRESFEAMGGAVQAVHVSGLMQEPEEFAGLAATLNTHQPDFVFALYSGQQGKRFIAAYQEATRHRSIPLATGGFMPADALRQAKVDVLRVATWLGAETRCPGFSDGCAQHGIDPTPYALLGHQAAEHILALAANASDPMGLLAQPPGQEVPGARASLSAQAPASHWLTARDVLPIVSIAPCTLTHLQPAPTTVKPRVCRSGWLNPYLVT